MPLLFPLLLAAAVAAPPGRVAIGQYGAWGAFADARGRSCYAIAMPARGAGGSVAAVAPPGRPRVELRPSRPARPGSLSVRVDGRALAFDGPSPAIEGRAAIVALRGGTRLRVSGTTAEGRRFRDDYPLRGFASALDAATLACLAR
ncbi:hypothetical protein [Sphingomonas sp.]|uniref:hypothetical protein n=1 Tax=Sphingomonas sp. TaxID=28214 RepID=UPI003B3A5CF4